MRNDPSRTIMWFMSVTAIVVTCSNCQLVSEDCIWPQPILRVVPVHADMEYNSRSSSHLMAATKGVWADRGRKLPPN